MTLFQAGSVNSDDIGETEETIEYRVRHIALQEANEPTHVGRLRGRPEGGLLAAGSQSYGLVRLPASGSEPCFRNQAGA
jgi:hypothetical protein